MSRANAAIRPEIHDLLALRSQARWLRRRPPGQVQAPLTGPHRSGLRGRGMDFREVRDYQPGDDIRCIDWRVTARTGRPHTKVFNEEREQPVILVIDQRPGMAFATRVAFKSVIAARAGVLLGWCASAHGDRVGALLFDQRHHRELRPSGGERGVLRLINALCQPRAHGPAHSQDLATVAARLRRVARPGSLVFIFSDFDGWDSQTATHLGQLARHCELVLGLVYDPLEARPPAGPYPVSDGQRLALLDAERAERICQDFQRHRQQLERFCQQHGLSFLTLPCDQPLHHSLHTPLMALTQNR